MNSTDGLKKDFFFKFYLFQYSWDLNTGLVHFSNGSKPSDHQMVFYLNQTSANRGPDSTFVDEARITRLGPKPVVVE